MRIMHRCSVKKLVSALACCLMLSSTLCSAFAAEPPSLLLTDSSAKPGETAVVAVSIQNNPGISAVQFNIICNSALTLSQAVAGNSFSSATVVQSPKGTTPAKVLFASQTADPVDGQLLVLTFDVGTRAAPGDYTVIVQCSGANDAEENDITIAQKSTTIRVNALSDDEKSAVVCSNACGAVGELVAVELSAMNLTAVVSAELELQYDESLLQYVGTRPADSFHGELYCGNASPKIAWAGLDETESGKIATCYFRVLSDEQEQFPAVITMTGTFYDVNEEKVENVCVNSGFITLIGRDELSVKSTNDGLLLCGVLTRQSLQEEVHLIAVYDNDGKMAALSQTDVLWEETETTRLLEQRIYEAPEHGYIHIMILQKSTYLPVSEKQIVFF